MYKVLSGLILNRIKPYIKDIIGDYQCGFMSGKSTIDHIFTVKQLVEKHYEFDNDLHLLFIDYKQAYDSINREVLWDTLITFGIPAKIVKMIKLCMNKTRCKVRFNQHNISDEFEVKTGLRQGDALSPILLW